MPVMSSVLFILVNNKKKTLLTLLYLILSRGKLHKDTLQEADSRCHIICWLLLFTADFPTLLYNHIAYVLHKPCNVIYTGIGHL